MAEKIRALFQKPIFVYLLGFYFFLYKTATYFPAFEAITFIVFCIGFLAITAACIYVFRKLSLDNYAAGLVFTAWILFFFPNELMDLLNKLLPIPQGMKWYVFSFLFILSVSMYLFFRKRAGTPLIQSANSILNTLLIINIFVTLINGCILAIKENKHAAALAVRGAQVSFHIPPGKPDIIWILLDEYASTPQLKAMGYNNTLGDSLRKKGFYILDSLGSRYDHTDASIESIFNFDDTLTPSNYKYAEKYIQDNQFIKNLEQNHYQFKAIDFLHFQSTPDTLDLPIFFPYSYRLMLLEGTVFSSFYYNYLDKNNSIIEQYNETVQAALNKQLTQQTGTPKFVWAHFLLPHSPFLKDANGTPLPTHTISALSIPAINKNYLGYLIYTNKTLLHILSQIKDWNNKIVIISGDHGFRFYLAPINPYRKKTFVAIYAPKKDTALINKIKYIQQIPLIIY